MCLFGMFQIVNTLCTSAASTGPQPHVLWRMWNPRNLHQWVYHKIHLFASNHWGSWRNQNGGGSVCEIWEVDYQHGVFVICVVYNTASINQSKMMVLLMQSNRLYSYRVHITLDYLKQLIYLLKTVRNTCLTGHVKLYYRSSVLGISCIDALTFSQWSL